VHKVYITQLSASNCLSYFPPFRKSPGNVGHAVDADDDWRLVMKFLKEIWSEYFYSSQRIHATRSLPMTAYSFFHRRMYFATKKYHKFVPADPFFHRSKCIHRAFADRRGYLMSLSRITTWPTWSLQLSVINNIMYAVKTRYSFLADTSLPYTPLADLTALPQTPLLVTRRGEERKERGERKGEGVN